MAESKRAAETHQRFWLQADSKPQKGHCKENAHLERSHRTNDDEFYIPRAMPVKGDADLLDEALGYICYYNNLREYSSLGYKTPFSYLKAQMLDIDDKIRFVIP